MIYSLYISKICKKNYVCRYVPTLLIKETINYVFTHLWFYPCTTRAGVYLGVFTYMRSNKNSETISTPRIAKGTIISLLNISSLKKGLK